MQYNLTLKKWSIIIAEVQKLRKRGLVQFFDSVDSKLNLNFCNLEFSMEIA
jgi:hypothetical protein